MFNGVLVQERDAMYGRNAHKLYQSVQVTTTDKGRLLLMMYEGAIKFLKQAKAGLQANDLAKFCKYLSKSQAVVSELMNTLDFEKGGQIAKDLDRLYDFILFYLTEANLYRDVKRIDNSISLIETIYSAYRDIIEGAKNESSEEAEPQQAEKGGEEGRRVQISL